MTWSLPCPTGSRLLVLTCPFSKYIYSNLIVTSILVFNQLILKLTVNCLASKIAILRLKSQTKFCQNRNLQYIFQSKHEGVTIETISLQNTRSTMTVYSSGNQKGLTNIMTEYLLIGQKLQDIEDRIIPPSTSIKQENMSNTLCLYLMKYLLTLKHL